MGLTKEPFLPDGDECADAWREVRWSNGVFCVACRSSNVECRASSYRGYLCRYHCLDCGKWFSDLTVDFGHSIVLEQITSSGT